MKWQMEAMVNKSDMKYLEGMNRANLPLRKSPKFLLN